MEVFAKEIDLEVPIQLRGLVMSFILGETTKKVKKKIPVCPTGFPLVVNIFGSMPKMSISAKVINSESRTVLAGQIVKVKINGELNGIYGQLGIILHPTAPYYLFHKTGEDLKNRWTPLDDISPIPSTELIKKLAKKELSHRERLNQILNFLILLENNRLPQIDWLEDSLTKIFEHDGKIDQKVLLKDSGLGSRHFRRVFKKIVGMPPKYFCKVVQMNTAFEAINALNPKKIHHIALDCGYYDQAHFINDFHNMFGTSPEKFLNSEESYLKNYMGRRGT